MHGPQTNEGWLRMLRGVAPVQYAASLRRGTLFGCGFRAKGKPSSKTLLRIGELSSGPELLLIQEPSVSWHSERKTERL